MKLRVVGWVYPYYNFEHGEATWAVRNAIIDEIRKRGYNFSGRSHQDEACTPVLNNGKKYLFSTRGWGDIMAEAHGHVGCMDYTLYDFPILPREEKLPDSKLNEFDSYLYNGEYDFNTDFEEWFENFIDQSEETRKILMESYRNEQRWLIPETELNERFELEVSEEVFSSAQNDNEVKLEITPELRYIDTGDTLALTFGKIATEFTVVNVERKREFSEQKLLQLQLDMKDFHDRDKAKLAQEEIDNSKMILVIKLKKVTN